MPTILIGLLLSFLHFRVLRVSAKQISVGTTLDYRLRLHRMPQQALLDVLDNVQKEETDRAPVRPAINGRVR